MTILLAVVAGGALGYVFARGDFCFHSTWRNVFAPVRELSLVRAYATLLLVSTPLVQLLRATDVIDPYIPPLSWGAALLGGLLFGTGMVTASTCVSGMFYKLGGGMLGMFAALAAWASGDVLVYRGPLSGLRDRLTDDPLTFTNDQGLVQTETFSTLFGQVGVVLIAAGGLGVAWKLRRASDNDYRAYRRESLLGWVPLGLATSAVMVGAWFLARWHGADYTYGTSGVPSAISRALFDDENISWWIPLGLLSLVPGALLAATRSGRLWVRGETTPRYVQLSAGGLLMGVGAGLAGGCNLGHSMVGVPLLSLGSIVTTFAIVLGVFIADRAVRRLQALGG